MLVEAKEKCTYFFVFLKVKKDKKFRLKKDSHAGNQC